MIGYQRKLQKYFGFNISGNINNVTVISQMTKMIKLMSNWEDVMFSESSDEPTVGSRLGTCS